MNLPPSTVRADARPRSERPAPVPGALQSFAIAIGLPPHQATELQDAKPFIGPSGLACRVHADPSSAALRPEVLLPLSLGELSANELRSLFRLQAFMLSEFGWYLGPGPDDLVILAAPQWIENPEVAAAALDLANGLARGALAHLLDEDTGAENASQSA